MIKVLFIFTHMIRFNLFFFLFIPLPGITQEKLQGTVESFSGKEPIPYVNIIPIGKQGGAYSDEEGFFEINVTSVDSLIFSSIGYKRITICVEDIKNQNHKVYLHPDIAFLQSVTIKAKKVKVKSDRKEFGYLKTKRRSTISAGMPGIQFATFIKNDFQQEGFIESLLLGITAEKKSRIRIRFYEPTVKNSVGAEITKQNFLFDVAGHHKPLKIDMAKYQIPFSTAGIVVAIEFLGELDKDGKIRKGTISKTMLYLTDGKDAERNTWQSYRERTFVRESFSDNQQNTSNAMIGLSAIFYRD
jgi:hypothetical protein